nr:hypothetical protein Iba_chr13aCG11200 [Ipomoea batatas]
MEIVEVMVFEDGGGAYAGVEDDEVEMIVWEIPVVVMVTGELEEKLLGGFVEIFWYLVLVYSTSSLGMGLLGSSSCALSLLALFSPRSMVDFCSLIS